MPKITLEITGLHEILGRDYGIEEPYWGTSLLLSLTCIQKVPALIAPNANVKASSCVVPLRRGGLRDESEDRLRGRLVH